MNVFNPVVVAHRFVRSVVRSGDYCIDATVGNGHDSCLLAELVGDAGRVIGFDVQETAIRSCETALVESEMTDRVELLHKGHETLATEVEKRGLNTVRLVMFNLGYLPGSDKSVVTRTHSTLLALEQSLKLLGPDGAISVVAYRGHTGGNEEAIAVEKWIGQLPASSYFCVRFERWSRERGLTPVFYWIRRLHKDIA